MGKKVYAVKEGFKTGIFYSWDECEAAVKGYSGAKYKGFSSLKDAEDYLHDNYLRKYDGSEMDSHIPEIEPGKCIAYVDGSFNAKKNIYGYGVIMLPSKKSVKGSGNDSGMVEMRNVAGEIMGAVRAIHEAILAGYKEIVIYYDYDGISKWPNREWKTNKDETRKYAEYVNKARSEINISFEKVKGHSKDYWNDRVDLLAKEAVGIQ